MKPSLLYGFGRSIVAIAVTVKPKTAQSTTTTQLPKPNPVFKGRVEPIYKNSDPNYPLVRSN